uniref:Uncharacterized protein n=1 Tax=Arundo donax TaxID=35708 RepID=A0A0A9HHT6_ARUDO
MLGRSGYWRNPKFVRNLV